MTRTRRTRITAVVGLAALIAVPAGLRAQVREAGSVSGVVVDAATGGPIAGATVTLEPMNAGLVVDGRAGRAGTGWSVVTDATGAYTFTGIVPGTYRLYVARIGYRPAQLEASVRRPGEARLSVGLTLAPVALAAIGIEERTEAPFRRTSGDPGELTDARIAIERRRQEQFLTSDSRAITAADLVEGVTLGEGDVFRALQRLPGVATRDDYTAELWTRGAPWSQTRVTFDGVPLFNPVHAVGVFSGLSPEILGAVFFHPGVRPVALGGAAGAVDLRTRSAGGSGEMRGAADLSMASARVALDQRVGDRGGWVFAARRSYLDVLDGGLDWLGMEQVALPYAFHDVAARIDVPIGVSSLEASVLWEEDRLYGDVDGVLERTSARWGNAAARITLASRIGGLAVRNTVGVSRYGARTWPNGEPVRGEQPTWVEPPSDNRVVHGHLAGELSPAGSDIAHWRVGYDVAFDDVRYHGPAPRHHPVTPDTTSHVRVAARAFTLGTWAERRWVRGSWTIEPGARIELGRAERPGEDASEVRVAPRILVRWMPTSDLSFSVGAARSWQALQGLALAGPSAHPAFHAGQFWVLGGGRVPVLRTDIITLGAERWLGRGFLASATAYVRRADGLALPDPAPGPLAGRPLVVTGSGEAWGIDASVRRVAGRWTASAAYTYGDARVEAGGYSYPAPADRRHRLDVLAGVRIGGGVSAGAAYTAMTGAPYTRAFSRATAQECSLFGFACGHPAAAVQEPNGLRTPDYRSLDAMLQWNGTWRGVELGAYLQLRNVLGRDNASTYSGSFVVAREPHGTRRFEYRRSAHWLDRFEQGLPRVPLVGARIAF